MEYLYTKFPCEQSDKFKSRNRIIIIHRKVEKLFPSKVPL